jgi:hypothetical protein
LILRLATYHMRLRSGTIVRKNSARVKYRTYFLKILAAYILKGLTLPAGSGHDSAHPHGKIMWVNVG